MSAHQKTVLQFPEQWETCKAKYLALCKRKGCYAAVIEGGEPTPEQIEKAHGHLVDCLHDDLLPVIAGCDDPVECLELLHEHLFMKSGANRSALFKQLVNLTQLEGDTVDAFFARMDVLVKRLEAQLDSGEMVNNYTKVSIVQTGLDDRFRFLKALWNSQEATGERGTRTRTYARQQNCTRYS